MLLILPTARLGVIVSDPGIPDPEHVLRRLVPAQLLRHPSAHLVVCRSSGGGVCGRLQERADDLAVFPVFETDDAGFADGGVGDEAVLDLGRGDVFAAWRDIPSVNMEEDPPGPSRTCYGWDTYPG